MSQSPENPYEVNPAPITPGEGPSDPARRRVVKDGLNLLGASVTLLSIGDYVRIMSGYGAAIENQVNATVGTAVPSSGESQDIITAFHQTVDDAAATAVESGASQVTVPITNSAGLSKVFKEREDERLRNELRGSIASKSPFPMNRILLDIAGVASGLLALVGGSAVIEPRRSIPSPAK